MRNTRDRQRKTEELEIYIYIYIKGQRDRERHNQTQKHTVRRGERVTVERARDEFTDIDLEIHGHLGDCIQGQRSDMY